jgi:predicted N-formylglutamate amidohydrolase
MPKRSETARAGFDRLLVTCEHGGHRVPAAYRPLFAGHAAALESHRGWDPGALIVARRIAKAWGAPLVAATVSRLVVDLNRSLHHPRVFSPFTASLPEAEREKIVARYYLPHRDEIAAILARWAARGERTLHLAVHSFTPVLDGERRNAELGLLFDPKRAAEARLCRAMQAALGELAPQYRVRRNYPYAGVADGLTTALRKVHGDRLYAGVEIEINQAEAAPAARLKAVGDALLAALATIW